MFECLDVTQGVFTQHKATPSFLKKLKHYPCSASAMLHAKKRCGDRMRITILPKGGGSERT